MCKERTCYIISQRDIPLDKLPQVRAAMRRELLAALQDGYTYFISSLSKGRDLLFAEQALLLQNAGCPLIIEAVLPYRNRMNCREALFERIITHCQSIGCLGEKYTPSNYVGTIRAMVERSSRVLVALSEDGKDRAYFAAFYARVMEREMRVIRV